MLSRQPQPRPNTQPQPRSAPPDASRSAVPWIGVHFLCANAYVRVYRAASGQGYHARCPKCGHTQRFIVADGGTDHRFFEISC